MIDIKNCPSSLQAGYENYSSKAIKTLFAGVKVNPILSFNIDEFRNSKELG